MKKVFYWSPYLSNVATINNVINSAISLTKYSRNYAVSFIDVIGEWVNSEKILSKNNIDIKKLNSLILDLPKIGFIKSRIYSILIFLFNFFSLRNLLKTQKPEYLIIHLLTSLPLILLVIFKFETKFILRISGLPKLNFFRKFLWNIAANKLHMVTCPSKQTLDDLSKLKIFDNSKLVVVYDPILNVSLINKKKNDIIETYTENKAFFLNIGRLTKQKNQVLLINLFENIIKNNNKLILYIIGNGENKNLLMQKIKQKNLEKNIFLLGEKKNIFPYFKNAKAVIISSLWEDPGAVMVESAFCNTPIISSNCPNGPTEFLDNDRAGYLFENNNFDSFRDSFNQFLNDDEHKIIKKKIEAKKNSKKYTFFNHFKKLNRVLNG